MKTSTKFKRFVLAATLLAAASPGCRSMQSGSLNPFSGFGSKDQEGKIAVKQDSSKPGFFSRLAGAFGSKSDNGTNPPIDDRLSLKNTPTSLGPEVYVANGQLWESSGSFDRAEENYQKALEVDAKNAAALAALARMSERQNKLTESVQYFNQAIEVDPSDPALYNDLGLVLAQQKQYPAAIEQIQRAIAIAPTNKRFANHLATVYMDAGNKNDAMKTLAKAHEPAVANYNMAYLSYKRQNFPEARQHLQSALQSDPNLQPARNLLDKLGGTQVAQLAQDATNAVSNVGQRVQQVTSNLQNAVNNTTSNVSSGLQNVTAPVGGPVQQVTNSNINIAPISQPPIQVESRANPAPGPQAAPLQMPERVQVTTPSVEVTVPKIQMGISDTGIQNNLPGVPAQQPKATNLAVPQVQEPTLNVVPQPVEALVPQASAGEIQLPQIQMPADGGTQVQETVPKLQTPVAQKPSVNATVPSLEISTGEPAVAPQVQAAPKSIPSIPTKPPTSGDNTWNLPPGLGN